MAYKILTEQEAYNIGQTGTPTANLLCTYARAQALGCTANSGYSLASNQLVYEGSLVKNVCVYSITSGPYEDQADCEYGDTSTTFTYNVSGCVNASNQRGYVSGNVGSWSQDERWEGTRSAEYTHPGCPNSITITWDIYQEDCGPSCEDCITSQYESGYGYYYKSVCSDKTVYICSNSGQCASLMYDTRPNYGWYRPTFSYDYCEFVNT